MTHWRKRRRVVLRDWQGLAFWLVLSCALAWIGHIIANDIGTVPPSVQAAIHP